MAPTPTQRPRGLLSPPPTGEGRRTNAQRLDILEAQLEAIRQLLPAYFRQTSVSPPTPHIQYAPQRSSHLLPPPPRQTSLRYSSYPRSQPRRVAVVDFDSDSDDDIIPSSDSDDKPTKSQYASDDNDDSGLEYSCDDDEGDDSDSRDSDGSGQREYGLDSEDQDIVSEDDAEYYSQQSDQSAETSDIDIGSDNDSQQGYADEDELYDPYDDGADSGVEYHFAGTFEGVAWVE